jgi:hypothetical protein
MQRYTRNNVNPKAKIVKEKVKVSKGFPVTGRGVS